MSFVYSYCWCLFEKELVEIVSWMWSYVTVSCSFFFSFLHNFYCDLSYFFKGDLFTATFLIKNGALVNAATLGAQETPLHLVALYSSKKHSADVMSDMAQIAEALLQAGANPNMQDNKGR